MHGLVVVQTTLVATNRLALHRRLGVKRNGAGGDRDSIGYVSAIGVARRGFGLSNEVLTYILSRSQRDIASLWQIVAGVDALSLALKRPVTVPLLREFLARNAGSGHRSPEV